MSLSGGPRRWIAAGLPLAGPGQRIGLLGGSFNPAHAGHRHVSDLARARLALDAVWWLVSPQNPLKDEAAAPHAERVASARRLAAQSFIKVTGLERTIGTRHTVDTIRFLVGRLPAVRFVWLMGADNLATLHHWKDWRIIARTVPLAVIDRPGWSLAAVSSPAARLFERFRIEESDGPGLADRDPPAWVFIHGPKSPLSSTAIRTGP